MKFYLGPSSFLWLNVNLNQVALCATWSSVFLCTPVVSVSLGQCPFYSQKGSDFRLLILIILTNSIYWLPPSTAIEMPAIDSESHFLGGGTQHIQSSASSMAKVTWTFYHGDLDWSLVLFTDWSVASSFCHMFQEEELGLSRSSLRDL